MQFSRCTHCPPPAPSFPDRFTQWNSFFNQQITSLLLLFVYQVDPYFVNSIDMCSTNEITKSGIYTKKSIKNHILSLKRFGYFFSFNEKIAFKNFLYINITKFRFLLFFSDRADIKKWKLKIFQVGLSPSKKNLYYLLHWKHFSFSRYLSFCRKRQGLEGQG